MFGAVTDFLLSRDQELRFTVHESPDYYKLKCSVFNDDKKTDLIGEAWIDLQGVIIPGGGKSDQWQQLNFKGKYAGDIRMELTYYDTRPKPETIVEARKQRDKSHSVASDALSTASGPRQLGPREIKRRPLPPGPGGFSSSTLPGPNAERWPSDEPPEAYGNHGYSNANPPPRPPKQKFVPETPDDVGYDLHPQFGPDSYEPQYESHPPYHERHPSTDFQSHYDQTAESYGDPDPFVEDPYQRRPLPVPAQPTYPQAMEEPQEPERQSPSASQSPYSSLQQTPYHSSPPRTQPATPPALTQSQQWNNRASTSPTKYSTYRDSPLRQSISQYDMPHPAPVYSDPRFDEDEPPPPPPAHRDQMSRGSVPSAYYPDSQDQPSPQPLVVASRDSHGHPSPRTPIKFQSVEERSPLQRLERDYDPYQSTPPSAPQDPQRPLSLQRSYGSSPMTDHDRYPMFPAERRKSNTYEGHQPGSSANDLPLSNPIYDQQPAQARYQEGPREDFRHSTGYAPPRRAQTFDTFELNDENRVRRSDPMIVRPRAISPNPNHNIPRKSITPTPDDHSPISSNPYGPDAYDVLNPGTSPISDRGMSHTPEGALEAARQKEVDKLRDQGPIIGNDGRVIDPSDHLPADTWAPEPERKQRKPEHVIKIRTREEARLHRSAAGSPASVRPHSIASSPYQTPPKAPGPAPAPAPSPYHSSPVPVTPSPQVQAESPGGRNRLRKPMPQRPLPTQPYPHPQSSPVVPTLPSVEPRPSPASQRYTIHSSPAGSLPQHPALGEYQVPPGNSYSPHGVSGPPPALEYRPEYTQTPPRAPPEGLSEYGTMNHGSGPPFGGESSLALELSRIDIGPSRMGRSSLRPQRAYGAY